MLQQHDHKDIPETREEIRLFAVIRDEAPRLPYFIKHYATLGVDRFLFVDNGSIDDTLDQLSQLENVHVFRTNESFAQARCGSVWLQHLVSRFATGLWAVLADADELLVYPGCEELSLKQLCRFLSFEGADALASILVDMYSERAIADTIYTPGTSPLEVCPYYESDSIVCAASLGDFRASHWKHIGGMRYRLFNLPARLDKISLIRYKHGMQFRIGQHELSTANLSKVRGAMLHFKFLSTFHERVSVEAGREEHWNQSKEYKRYAEISSDPLLSAYCPSSKRFSHSDDLLRSGIMIEPDTLRAYRLAFASPLSSTVDH